MACSLDRGFVDSLGDGGEWPLHIPTAWQMVAGDMNASPPKDPGPPFGWVPKDNGWLPDGVHSDLIGFWTPLVHVVGYGLGWAHPKAGLARWYVSRGRVQDPVLQTVSRWWGRRRIADFLLWSGFADGLPGAAPRLAAAVEWAKSEDRARMEAPDWQLLWGDGDHLHLTRHVSSPIAFPAGQGDFQVAPEYRFGQRTGRVRGLLLRESYVGWYSDLDNHSLEFVSGDLAGVDVYVKSIGFLGTYRKHELTGRWYRGREDIHLWGN